MHDPIEKTVSANDSTPPIILPKKRITVDLEGAAVEKLDRLCTKRATTIKTLVVQALSLLDAATDDRYDLILRSKDNSEPPMKIILP